MGIRRRARKHKAGVDYVEETYEFQIGDRVLTVEGILGTVTAVEDGPYAGSEQYVVELDADLGGGDYMASELSRPDGVTEASMSGQSPKGDFRNSDEKTARKTAERSDSGMEWENTSSIFGAEATAQVGEYTLRIFTVVGGSNTETYPWGWDITKDGEDVADGAATSGRDAAAQAEAHVKGLGKLSNQEMGYPANGDLTVRVVLEAPTNASFFKAVEDKLGVAHGEVAIHGVHRLNSYYVMGEDKEVAAYEVHYSMVRQANQEMGYPDPVQQELEAADMAEDEDIYSLASDDYPELAEILDERPPLPHSERLGFKTAARTLTFTHPRTGEVFTRSTDADYTHVSFDNRNQIAWHTSEDIARRRSSNYFPILPSNVAGREECHVCEGTGKIPDRRSSGELVFHSCHLCGGKGWIVRDSNGRVVGVKIAVKAQEGDGTFMENVAALSKESMGWWMDKFLVPLAEDMISRQPAEFRFNPATGRGPSFDWCRFRYARFCYFPDALDQAATDLAGYAVWIPVERGFCPREAWDGPAGQKNCPVGEPGPNALPPDDPLADATVSWADGGQRYDSKGNPLRPPGR